MQRISIPAFARLQSDRGRLSSAFHTSLFGLLGVAVPVAVAMSLCAVPLIAVFYGAKWHQAAEPLAFLAFFGLARVIEELLLDVLVATARVGWLIAVRLLWLVALVPSLVIGAREGGLAGVGLAQLLVAGALVVPVTLFAVARVVSLREMVAFVLRVLAAAIASAACWYVAHRAINAPAVVRLLTESFVIGVVFLGLIGRAVVRRVRSQW